MAVRNNGKRKLRRDARFLFLFEFQHMTIYEFMTRRAKIRAEIAVKVPGYYFSLFLRKQIEGGGGRWLAGFSPNDPSFISNRV